MKKIEAIIRPAKLGEVCAALEQLGHSGLTISEVEGQGKQRGVVQKVRGKDYRVELLTKARLELIVPDEQAAPIITAIRDAAFTGEIGDGKIFVSDISDVVRIRTGEVGLQAI